MSQRYFLILALIILPILLPVWSYASNPHYSSQSSAIRLFLNRTWQFSPAIQSAEAEVNAASYNASALGRSIYNPELELDGERVRQDDQVDTYTLGISQTIDLFNKRGANRQVGQFALAQTQASLAAKKLSTATAALIALTEFNAAEKITILARKRTQLLQRFVRLTEKKYAAGDFGQTELDQSKLALSEAIAQQANAEVNQSRAKESLVAITNRVSNTVWPALPGRLPPPPHLPSDPIRMLQQLPSLQIFNYRANAANARIRVAKTNTHPDPTISLKGGQEDKKALIGLSLSVPLFVRNNFHDQVVGANQEAIAADKARLDAYWHAKARLQGTISRYKILYHSYKKWQEVSAGSLNGGIKLLDKLWDAGEINTTDYLIQLKQRIDSKIAGTELQSQTWQAWFQWLDASGSLNHWLGKDAQWNNGGIGK